MTQTSIRVGFVAGLLLVVLTLMTFWTTSAQAHEVRPGLLEIRESQQGWFDVAFKVPVRDGKVLGLSAQLGDQLTPVGQPVTREVPGARIDTSSFKAESDSITGMPIFIEGLSANQVDVLVQIYLADGTQYSAILKPQSPEYIVPSEPNALEVAGGYFVIGIEHILGGVDHLLFVFALMLLVANWKQLLKAVTAFTVAHSVTLALAVFGVLNMPSKPTEAVIALSIVFMAVEVIRKHEGVGGYLNLVPWMVAFAFGLVHGLGFAGALSDIGLPDNAVPLALLFFNLGVEAGQLLFIAVVLVVWWGIRRAPFSIPTTSWRIAAYCVGAVAAYWTIDRVAAFAI